MTPHPVNEPRLLVCHTLPSTFPVGSLLQAGAPAIYAVPNGSSVVAAARQMKAISAILIGMDSPDLEASAICRALKETRETASIPICVVAQRAQRKRKLEVLAAGVAEYLEAPWNSNEIALRLRKYWDFKGERCPHAAQGKTLMEVPRLWQHDLVWAAQQCLNQDQGDAALDSQSLARLLGVTESKLKAAFHEVLGVSIYDYLREQNMMLAETLLRESQLRIVDIAEMCEFSNAANFATAFRKFKGVAPSEYRQHERSGYQHSQMSSLIRTQADASH